MFCDVIAWADVETTGLDPFSGEKLLQVAMFVTDFEFNLLTPEIYETAVYYSEDDTAALKESTNDYVTEMHTKTGLWEKLPTGKPLEQIDAELAAYLESVAPGQGAAVLGGNSITLDRNFLNKYLPVFANQLHYRSIDVTTVALLAQKWYNGTQFEKKTTHNAIDDIQESIDELRYLREAVFKK